MSQPGAFNAGFIWVQAAPPYLGGKLVKLALQCVAAQVKPENIVWKRFTVLQFQALKP